MSKPTVFISSSGEDRAVAQELARQLETTADVTLWSEDRDEGSAESLAEVADRSDFAVFVGAYDWSPYPEPRPYRRMKAIFQLGFLAGRLGLSRTFVIGDPNRNVLPSDLTGLMFVPLSISNLPDLDATVSPAAAAIRSAIADIPPLRERRVEYYSCFISYAWKDKDFAARLHDDLKDVGVRSWLDIKELKTGDIWQEQIEKAIQAHDKMVLVLSRASVQSSWVQLEARNGLRLERTRKRSVLFPIRLDDAVFEVSGSRELNELKNKHIFNFTDWQDKNRYRKAFSQFARDLAISDSIESEKR
jgi:hypothetical protein